MISVTWMPAKGGGSLSRTITCLQQLLLQFAASTAEIGNNAVKRLGHTAAIIVTGLFSISAATDPSFETRLDDSRGTAAVSK